MNIQHHLVRLTITGGSITMAIEKIRELERTTGTQIEECMMFINFVGTESDLEGVMEATQNLLDTANGIIDVL